MSIKEDLITKGYFPNNLPPAFTSHNIARYFIENEPDKSLSINKRPVRAATYNASKRGLTRRVFTILHPTTAYDLADFMYLHWKDILSVINNTECSLSVPALTPEGDRALEITSHNELSHILMEKLSRFRFIAKTDISRFYHSIYTHSLSWAAHGKEIAKSKKSSKDKTLFCNELDRILRCGQDGQTIGIPVGPDVSRVIAEIVSSGIDREFIKRCDVELFGLVRHVDDIWIGANSYADVERALWRYRESIREFELDINEAKTNIFENNFSFVDTWPLEIVSKLEFAFSSDDRRGAERLRAALEYAFSYARSEGDEGILKYVIRQIDRVDIKRRHWKVVEQFLKRSAVHFGHTIDYVSQILIWRQLAQGDLDIESWKGILQSILDRQGRLGNDSEVCWAIYTCVVLKIEIPDHIAINIIRNCSGISIVSLLNCIEIGVADANILVDAKNRLSGETASGPYWPAILEWLSRGWAGKDDLIPENEVISAMSERGVIIFDRDTLPDAFSEIDPGEFGDVETAIVSDSDDYSDDIESNDDEMNHTEF